MRVIRIHAKPGGKTTVATEGFIGEECRDVSKPFETALGRVESEELTAEYFYETEKNEEHLRG